MGRPNIILLGVRLIIDIAHRITELRDEATKPHRMIGLILGIVLELSLLIHQIGKLDHHLRPPGVSTKAED